MSTLDFDIPFTAIIVAQSGIELLTGIVIMTSVTWQVLVVALLVVAAANYIKVDAISKFVFSFLCSGTLIHGRINNYIVPSSH